MNIPGFTAEASLKTRSDQYRLVDEYSGRIGGQTVIQQRKKLRDVQCNCDTQTNVCVCNNGRVFDLLLGEIK